MNTTVDNLRSRNEFWKYFFNICQIPHPSGHEAALRQYLQQSAEKCGLSCRVDAAGNLAIDRLAAVGCENYPAAILQAHLDMVPQKAPGVEFDFLHDSIVPVVEGDWVTTGGKTTLGADDGMGVALAMELLTDNSLQCGPLRAVFTVSEETGLGGAEDIDRDFLQADVLLNLDSDQPFTIGCAGGSRLSGAARLPQRAVSAQYCGVKFHLTGMHGGHSGVDIHLPVGSACCVINEFLRQLSAVEIAAVQAGTLHNAIAREAEVTAAIPAGLLENMSAVLDGFNARLNEIYLPSPGKKITLSCEKLASPPPQVLTSEAQTQLLELWSNLPHGVLETADNATVTSCNLAVVEGSADGEWKFILLGRSLYDEKRQAMMNDAVCKLQNAGFTAVIDSEYTSWRPCWDSPLLEFACRIYKELTNSEAQKTVIHGGLEPGLFCGMNPRLQMLSFAPLTQSVHSPQEKLNIPDVEKSRVLLRTLLERLNEMPAAQSR